MKMPNRYRALCIQGKIPELFDLLKRESSTSRTAASLAAKYENRFFRDPPRLRLVTNDPWIRSVMRCYQEYFIRVLTRKETPEEAEESLTHNLADLIDNNLSDIEVLENKLEVEFRHHGYHFVGGMTGPVYGPYVWKKTVTETYSVEVPLGRQDLTVHFMDDFIMQGCIHFASFGSVRTGGWAKEDGLYCVYSAYRNYLSTEEFTVSFLKHEAQHALDFTMFPKLESRDLEYRAKLVELIYTGNRGLFLGFLQYAENDPSNGHVYAAYKIVTTISQRLFNEDFVSDVKRWKDIPIERLQAQARDLYDDHTTELERHGSAEVTGII